MDLKKFSMATVGGFFAMFIPGGLWHMLIMKDFYDKYSADSALAEPNILFIILGVLILSALMAYMYPQGYKGGSPFKEGLRFGVVIGLLWILPINVIMIGAMGTSITLVVVDALYHMVGQGIGGIVIGYIYGSKSS
jgi:hypothetical protein